SLLNPFTWGKELTQKEKTNINKIVREHSERWNGTESLSSVYHNHVKEHFNTTRHGYVRRFMMDQFPQDRRDRLRFKTRTRPIIGSFFGGGGEEDEEGEVREEAGSAGEGGEERATG
ncbi:MAG: hypothetical protein SVS85_02200, partial [Candidatus Nanohaloarchaea archaeon]|nr:hypothetical protein [Candidatus Nanohaloarchaea archaeon]